MSNPIEKEEVAPNKIEISHFEEVATEDVDYVKTHDTLISGFPEGGSRAWLAVAGAFLCLFVGGVVCLSETVQLKDVKLTRSSCTRNTVLVFSSRTTPLTS